APGNDHDRKTFGHRDLREVRRGWAIGAGLAEIDVEVRRGEEAHAFREVAFLRVPLAGRRIHDQKRAFPDAHRRATYGTSRATSRRGRFFFCHRRGDGPSKRDRPRDRVLPTLSFGEPRRGPVRSRRRISIGYWSRRCASGSPRRATVDPHSRSCSHNSMSMESARPHGGPWCTERSAPPSERPRPCSEATSAPTATAT